MNLSLLFSYCKNVQKLIRIKLQGGKNNCNSNIFCFKLALNIFDSNDGAVVLNLTRASPPLQRTFWMVSTWRDTSPTLSVTWETRALVCTDKSTRRWSSRRRSQTIATSSSTTASPSRGLRPSSAPGCLCPAQAAMCCSEGLWLASWLWQAQGCWSRWVLSFITPPKDTLTVTEAATCQFRCFCLKIFYLHLRKNLYQWTC